MKKLYEETHIQDIAAAIREKNGSTDTYKPSEMAEAIKNIVSGGKSILSTEGTFTLASDVSSYCIDITNLGWVPDLVFIYLDEVGYTSNPTKAWLLVEIPTAVNINLPLLDYPAVDSGAWIGKTNFGALWRGAYGTDTQQVATKTINKVWVGTENASGYEGKAGIDIARSAGSYPIIAGDYKWVAYKLWED